jgi:hypothetical protein
VYLGLVSISGDPGFDFIFSVVIQVVLVSVVIGAAFSLFRR